MKRKISPDPVLMLITILVITGFQVYWLKDTYDRERSALQIKTNLAFQETIQQLQSARLKLPHFSADDAAGNEKTRIFFDENMTTSDSGRLARKQVVTMVNTIRDKINGSIRTDSTSRSTIIFTRGRDSFAGRKDSMQVGIRKFADSNNHIYNVLYRVDALQDSITLSEVIRNYAAKLKKENLDVLFRVTRSAGTMGQYEPDMSKVTVGFAHPVTYQVSLVSPEHYLLRKISQPILFSLFLIGVTILSFVLLYRNLSRQQRLAEIKNDFISNITHELKTPISTVAVAIEALLNFNAMDDPHKTKEYLTISSNELQRLSLLVDKVLKLSMFEKKEITLNKEWFDMKELIRQVLDTMRPQFEKQSATTQFSTDGTDFLIHADKLHITSVLYNLLDNALKYSRENLHINIMLSRQQNIFTLKVSDNGIGIAKDYLSKIFDKFFRVPTGDKHAVKGYGLGLSYVSEIVKRHMGYIYAESELGKGSSFIAKLPEKEADLIRFDDKRVIRRISLRMPTKKS